MQSPHGRDFHLWPLLVFCHPQPPSHPKKKKKKKMLGIAELLCMCAMHIPGDLGEKKNARWNVKIRSENQWDNSFIPFNRNVPISQWRAFWRFGDPARLAGTTPPPCTACPHWLGPYTAWVLIADRRAAFRWSEPFRNSWIWKEKLLKIHSIRPPDNRAVVPPRKSPKGTSLLPLCEKV